MSNRYCRLRCSPKGKSFRKETSPRRYIGARNILRPVLPKLPSGGGANAAALNQLVRVCELPCGSWPGTKLARRRSPKGSPVRSVFWPRLQQKIENGTPLARVTIPLVCQLPKIQLAGPMEKGFPFPIGNSYT